MRLLGPLSQRSQEEKLEMHPLKRHYHHRQQRQQTQQEEAEIQRRGRYPARSDRANKLHHQWDQRPEQRWRRERER